MTLDPRVFLRQLFDAAVDRARPARVLPAHLPPPPRGRTLVLGAGKAAAAMAAAVEAAWPAEAPLSGLVVVPYRHLAPGSVDRLSRIEAMEAAHPVPDAAGQRAAQRMLALTRGLTADDLVLCLLSGGGSALLSLPAPGLTLADKQDVHRALLASGAGIAEMNCLRRHLSAIKGGRLALACEPARVLTLAISDVPGDDPAVIASGPTRPDESTCADALAVAARHRVNLPSAAVMGLRSGTFKSPRPSDLQEGLHEFKVIAAPRHSLHAAAEFARAAGIAAHVLGDDFQGESRDVARVHAAIARSVARHGEPFAPPCVLLSGGETTVTLTTPGLPLTNLPLPSNLPLGRGGRSSEFLLAAAIDLAAHSGVWALAADTDGTDGTEDNAGALIGPDTLARAAEAGIVPRAHLDRHDAYGFFAALGDLVVTGPTLTNVNDFRAFLML